MQVVEQVNLGIVGGGTVGGGVYRALKTNGVLMASRLGVRFHVTRLAVRNRRKKRAVPIPQSSLTTDWRKVTRDPRIHVVLELMGGTTVAKEVTLDALEQGKLVVTANKALLSEHGPELFAAAKRHGSNLYYEASVAGGIPIIKVLREGMIGNRIIGMYGILNGTCNYILSRMKSEGGEFGDILADAQRLGYAEAEPSLDVDGHDALHKAGILASIAHGFWVNPKKIHLEGIRFITPLDIRFATQLGYTIKQLAVIKLFEGKLSKKAPAPTTIQVSVCPMLVPNEHVLASVNGVYNAVFVRGDIVGDTLYYGPGAGQDATASAVLSDLADAALDLKHGTRNRIPPFVSHAHDGRVGPMGEVVSRYYLRLSVIDRPGTLARVAAILARFNVGIMSVIQPEGHVGASVPLILMIHDAPNVVMRRALTSISRLSVIKEKPVMIRVERFE